MLKKSLYYSVNDVKISELRNIQEDLLTLTLEEKKKYEHIVQWCQKEYIFAHHSDETDYHFKLRQIYSAPYIIYGKGNIELLNRDILAVVGPRNISPYGKQVVEHLMDRAQHYNLVTISGLAHGVDMLCHTLSIDYKIPTIAVLGWWLARAMKSKQREMIAHIIEHGGLVLSEFKLGMEPTTYTFPQRNRIVAGLSDMIFVPEAAKKSGSLITVDFAGQMHKDVYGAPWSIFSPTSQGLWYYMQQWLVKPVVDMDVMLVQYFGKKVNNDQWPMNNYSHNWFADGEVSEVIILLQKNQSWLHLNELIHQTGLGIEDVMSQLSVGEVMGKIIQDGEIWRMV